jgi:hypothetical protein
VGIIDAEDERAAKQRSAQKGSAMAEKMIVVAQAGEFRAAKVYLPGDDREEHPRAAWFCEWCDWLCVAESVEDLPPHECLGFKDGVRAIRS